MTLRFARLAIVWLLLGAVPAPVPAQSWDIADYAIDDHLVTRWSAGDYTDRQWLQVDLGKSRVVKEVVLTWELAYAKDYLIQASSDGTSWSTVAAISDGDGFVDRVGIDANARFIRMQSLKRANEYGVSLFDFTLCSAADDGRVKPRPAGAS